MKILFLLLLLPLSGFSQTFSHPWFHGFYDVTKHTPQYVVWDLSLDHIQCVHRTARTNNFRQDPQVKDRDLNSDYAAEGFDKGHVSAAQDNACDPVRESECFYFSNMVPQRPNLNRGTYKAWEEWSRKEVVTKKITLHIVGGPLGTLMTIGKDKVVAPQYSWVAVLEGSVWTCYLFPNTDTVDKFPFTHYAVDLQVLDKLLGFQIENLK